MSTDKNANFKSLSLFGKTRQAILGFLFTNADRSFHVNGLARLTGISPGAVLRELKKLAEAEILTASN